MTLLFFHDHRADIGDQIVVRSPLSKQGAKVVIVLAEKTCAELAIRSQPDAGAVATKRLGHRGNEADFTGRAIGKAILAGGFAALVRYLLERPASVNALMDLRGGDDQVAGPVAGRGGGPEIHKKHDDAVFAGGEGRGGFPLVLVVAGPKRAFPRNGPGA